MADALAIQPRRSAPPPVSLRPLALPAEHGGWGLLLEPLLLGLLVAPSPEGGAVALAAVSAFLARHPARLALADVWHGARHRRTPIALAIGGAYAALAALAAFAALRSSEGALGPFLAFVAPLAVLHLAYDVRRQGRDATAELAGALALSAGAPAVALAAGWPLAPALGLWLLVAGRAIGSVLDVRCRLRRQRGVPSARGPVFLTQFAFALCALAAASRGALPLPAALVSIALLARSIGHHREGAGVLRPQAIGWREARAGAAATLAWALCYRWWP